MGNQSGSICGYHSRIHARRLYRADYVLMIAEAFHADQNADAAIRRLAVLGSSSPAEFAAQALQTGQTIGYSSGDISMLQELTRALQAYQPAPSPMDTPQQTAAPKDSVQAESTP